MTIALAADNPLEVRVADEAVTALVLDCGAGKTLKANVNDGLAVFNSVPHTDCKVLQVREGGIIDSPGKWSCTLDQCVQDDVDHADVLNAPGRINIVLPGLPKGASIEVQCTAGYRERQYVVQNTATFLGVPFDQCAMLVKGAVPARFSPISEGTWYCQLTGTTAVCHKKL
jgi:hypothetical protein